jgi:hypothetical protein
VGKARRAANSAGVLVSPAVCDRPVRFPAGVTFGGLLFAWPMSHRRGPGLPVSPKEVEEFSAHCVYIRSVYTFMMRIWRDSDDGERQVMEAMIRSRLAKLTTAHISPAPSTMYAFITAPYHPKKSSNCI